MATPLAPTNASANTPSASKASNWLLDDLDLLATPVLQPATGDTKAAAAISSSTGTAALFDWSAGGGGTGTAPPSHGLDLSTLMASGPTAAASVATPSKFAVPVLPALLGQPVLSERAQRLLDSLPDLSFMSSRLITFLNAPVTGNALV